MRKPYILLSFILATLLPPAQGQQWENKQNGLFRAQRTHNLNLALGIGAADLMVDGRLLSPSKIGPGARFEVGYTYLTGYSAGIHTGIGVRYAQSGFALERVESSAMGYISANNANRRVDRSSHFTSITRDVHEQYNIFFIDMPLHLALQERHTYLNIGVRLLVPVSAKAHCNYGATSVGVGYEIDGFGQRVETPINMKNYEATESDYALSSLGDEGATFMWVAALSAEYGYRWCIDEQRQLMVSLYADVGLNRTKVGDGEPLVVLRNGEPQMRTCMQSNVASHLRYLDIGISLTYNMSFGRRIGMPRARAFKPGVSRRRYRR